MDLLQFKPDYCYTSFTEIPFDELVANGIEYLIIDVDNTIARPKSDNFARGASKEIDRAKEAGIKDICLLSNTITGQRRVLRVRKIAQQLQVKFICLRFSQRKPKPTGFQIALRRMGAVSQNTAVIGDQIFTDIWGGNRVGCTTILVESLGRDNWITILSGKRLIEQLLLRKWKLTKQDRFQKVNPEN